jgi:hypothetical protein
MNEDSWEAQKQLAAQAVALELREGRDSLMVALLHARANQMRDRLRKQTNDDFLFDISSSPTS